MYIGMPQKRHPYFPESPLPTLEVVVLLAVVLLILVVLLVIVLAVLVAV